MRLIIASNNPSKAAELKTMLRAFFDEVLTLKEAGVEVVIEEDGKTFAENAMKKACTVAQVTGCAALGDDSGLMVDALDGAPGVYSARFSGEGATDERNNALLLDKLKDVPAPRSARFVCTIALVRPDKPALLTSGVCKGQILSAPQGEGGFGYDPLFLPDGETLSFGQMSGPEKNRISHRAMALRQLREQLEGE